ncbi:proteasome assembly chaperone 2 isoform X1 [Lutra lutra]|uniref:proteasome assembly chaperone 2 isoform X1 n=1 Tax=Lutra lutra TaxID=9657 RepID=UPI001FD55843|nr:proteasome assembly chaperone 2 isoform X1 [Lutra lutra]
MFVPCGESVPDLAGYTFLMPAVSVGNVGQLAMDLIISTLNMCKIGYFYTDCLVPMVGNNPYATAEENSTELSINAEIYALPSKKLVALQLRSIFIKYKSKPFCEKLLSWVKSSNCAKVIVLSSSHSYHRNDLQLRSAPFRYLLTPCVQKSIQTKIMSLNWEEMEKSPCIPEIDESEFCIRIPGGGITKTLYDEGCSFVPYQRSVLKNFCVHLRKMCILLLLSRVFCMYLLGFTQCCVRLLFPSQSACRLLKSPVITVALYVVLPSVLSVFAS